MPERDGYIPGVPCWVDASQPDPEAAVEFYSGLFGWEFEDVMPPGSEGKYFIARLRPRSIFELGRDVAAVGSIPQSAPPTATWNTYVRVDSADETASKVRDAGADRWSPSLGRTSSSEAHNSAEPVIPPELPAGADRDRVAPMSRPDLRLAAIWELHQ
jgi:predicted enzyme related to lactoylglutathione lyase